MSFAKPHRAKSEVTNIKGTNTCLETKDADFLLMNINPLLNYGAIYLSHKFFPS